MPVTVMAVTSVNEENPEALSTYLYLTTPLIHQAGGRVVRSYTVKHSLEGGDQAQTVTLIEYPSKDVVDRLFNSSEYAAIRPIREQAFCNYQVSIVE